MYLKQNECDCGKEHSCKVKKVLSGNGVISLLPEELQVLGIKKPYILADKNTYSAAGKKAEQLLINAGIPFTKYIFNEEHLEPDEASVGSAIMNLDTSCDGVVAVGSGVINDIAKIIATVSGKPYIIVATAPSMDGYASVLSSMSKNGLKVSITSKCADVIIGDTDILKKAPMHMLISGLGDMLAKYVSICEWRISHIITGEYYCEEIAKLVRQSLKTCVDNASGLLKRDDEAVEAVFNGLVKSGVAMAYAGISRPASGVEHSCSHIWEMRGMEFDTPNELHGIQCAVATLIAVNIYEKILNIVPDREKACNYVEGFDFSGWSRELKEFLGRSAESMIALEEKEQKYNPEKHRERLEIIIDKWDEVISVIKEELPSHSKLLELYENIGMPKSMNEIGIDEKLLPLTLKAAKDIRDKYILPKLCWDLGVLDEIV